MRSLVTRIPLYIGIAAVLLLGIYVGGGYFTRDRNMRLADQHAAMVEAALAEDTRFNDVSVGTDYRGAGGLRVRGTLQSQDDWRDLQCTILATHPPTQVFYRVEVDGELITHLERRP